MKKKMVKKKETSLTLQFIPHKDILGLSSEERVNKLLSIVKLNKIILLEGRIKSQEESELIRRTMEEIDDSFKGIEISPILVDNSSDAFLQKLREHFIKLVLGTRSGLTIIGPANIVKEIKQDPDKIQLFMEDLSKV